MKRFLLTLAFAGLLISASAEEKKPTVYMVSNAHFDTQWNWDVQRSISEYLLRTVERNLFLLDNYPNYIFNFEGGVKYSWIKEYYPQYWARIQKHVKDGRWHVAGSSWDANDPNMPSTESFMRNILYAQHFYRDEFGVQSTDIFLPDCFGFGYGLPTMAAHAGLIGFSTQKLIWRYNPFFGDSKVPFNIGIWEGIDGSRIMAVTNGGDYITDYSDMDLSYNEEFMELAKQNVNNTLYRYYGTGDKGGSAAIPTAMSIEKSVNSDGPLKVISAESDRMYKDYLPYENHPELPVYKGELLMDVHATGCYTSQAAMKLFNRRNETLADAAERSAVIADWAGTAKYPKEFLSNAWKRMLWHQFHDDLTGTSIPRAYEFSWNDELISLKHFENVLTSSVGGFSRMLDTQVKGTPVVVYNPAAFAVNEIVEVSFEGLPETVAVYGPDNKKVASQIVDKDGKKVLLIRASVPAMGYSVYDVRKGSTSKSTTLKATENGIENSIYKLTFDKNGDICSIVDKRNGRELVEEGKAVRLALFTENKSEAWPAWEILKDVLDGEPISITEDVKITVVENGPVRATVCVERKHGESVFKQYVSLTEGGQDDRIDISNDVLWQSTMALLKAEFPLTVSNENAVYDIGVGTVERGNNIPTSYEVPAHQWADITEKDGNYGVAVMNDCKYGWDKPTDNTIRLTLLHTPYNIGDFIYQNHQDFGRHIFKYSIVGHNGDYRQACVTRKAEVLNQPLKAFVTPKHSGTYGRKFSFAESLNTNVALKAVKQAEDSDAYVVRFIETSGKGVQKGKVQFAADILEAKELNGNEEFIADVAATGKTLEFDIKPFSIKTFLVRLAKPQAPAAQESAFVELPYNKVTASYNAFRRHGDFDGLGNAYAAELLPEVLTYNNIDFKLGNPALENAVECSRNKVALPSGNYNTLYVLAAATARDTKCKFNVGGLVQEVVVPYYGGFIGQWGHTGHTEAYLKAADIAYVGTHKHNCYLQKDMPYDFTYMFCIKLDIPEGATNIVLPNNNEVVVFAATAVNEQINVAEPCADFINVGIPATNNYEKKQERVNHCLGKTIIGLSSEAGEDLKGEFAIDGDEFSKWADYAESALKFIEIDLGEETEITGWRVLHDIHFWIEQNDCITEDYNLQVKNSLEEEWRLADKVEDNRELVREHKLPIPVKARYVRLEITKPEQNGRLGSRIREFEVF